MSWVFVLNEKGAVAGTQIMVIAEAKSAPIQRLIQHAEKRGTLINLTWGRRRRSVIILTGGYVVLTAIPVSTLVEMWTYTGEGSHHVDA